jgi:regulator of replication initiation timing
VESTILDAFLEYGSMGLFAGFLVWQHLSMQKRFDKLVERFQGQLEGIQSKSEANEDKLRDRYDVVIKQLQDDKTTFRLNVAEQISEAMRSIESLKIHMDSLPFDNLQIQIEAIALNQRNSHLILEKGMDQLRKMEEDQRLKEMAKRMSDGKDT